MTITAYQSGNEWEKPIDILDPDSSLSKFRHSIIKKDHLTKEVDIYLFWRIIHLESFSSAQNICVRIALFLETIEENNSEIIASLIRAIINILPQSENNSQLCVLYSWEIQHLLLLINDEMTNNQFIFHLLVSRIIWVIFNRNYLKKELILQAIAALIENLLYYWNK